MFEALPGWLYLLAGLTLLAMALLTPTWQANCELTWQRDLMRLQAQRLERQARNYQQFHAALVAEDPILLERLVFIHLHQQPQGKQPLEEAGPLTVAGPAAQAQASLWQDLALSSGLGELSAAVDAWLAEPLPVVGVDIAPPKPVNSRLTRLTQGPSRLVMLVAALACLAAGVWSGGGEPGDIARSRATPIKARAAWSAAMLRPD